LQERELDMDVEALCLEGGESVGNRQELLPHGRQMFQAFLQTEIGQVVGANLIAQESGEFLVLLHKGVLEIGPKDMMTVLDLLQRSMQFPLQLFGDAVPKISLILLAVSRHNPISQDLSKIR
jgi:hypothetical protein